MAVATDATTRVLNTTYQKWLEGFSNETEEDHPLLALLKARGNIVTGCSGVSIRESVKYHRLELEGYDDMDRTDWVRKTLHKYQEHEYRGLRLHDTISEKEMLQNAGMEARVKLFEDKLGSMRQDAEDDLGKFFYLDGQATANLKKLEGFLTFCGYTQGSQNAAHAFATVLADTYGGLSTAYANYGGTMTISGATRIASDPRADFWSPVIVNSTNTTTGGGSAAAWSADALELLGLAITHAVRGNNKRHQLDCFTMNRGNFAVLKDVVRAKERVIVDPGPGRSLLVSLGFKNVIQVDGVDCIVDPDVPTTDGSSRTIRAFGWNFQNVKLMIMGKGKGDSIWQIANSYMDPDDLTYKWQLGFYGNLVFKPRYQVLITDAG